MNQKPPNTLFAILNYVILVATIIVAATGVYLIAANEWHSRDHSGILFVTLTVAIAALYRS